jgi:hypothetical protein
LAVTPFIEAYLNEKLNEINMETRVSSTANVQSKSFKDDQLTMEEIFKKLNYQPSGLTDYEQENPLDMITEFFSNHDLHDLREKAWQLYKGWVNSSSDFADGAENAEMLFFYTQLINFMNASYLYTKKKSKNPRKFEA